MGNFRQIWEFFDQKIVFFSARATPLKLVFIGAQGVFRKPLRSVSRNLISQNSKKEDPLGRQGVRIPERGRHHPPPP